MRKIVTVSDRGQITIPKKIRDLVPAFSFSCFEQDGKIVLDPLHMMDSQGAIITPQPPQEKNNTPPSKEKDVWAEL